MPELALAQRDYDEATLVAMKAASEAAAYYHPRFAAVAAIIDDKQSFVLRVPEQSNDAVAWLQKTGAAVAELIN